MPNQFFVLIDKRDSEKFRKFHLGKFDKNIKQSLDDNSANFVWGIHKSKVSSSVWSRLKKNDVVYFSIPEENFKIFAKISKKSKNSELGQIIYQNEPNAKSIEYFLFFKEIQKTNLSFNEVIHNSITKISAPISGIYEIKKSYYKDKHQKTKPKKFILSKITKGPPKKNKSEVWRFLRDTKPVKKLKELYKNKCQICEKTFEIGKNQFYSEVHHYWSLEQQGDDDISNMIVVCPNHHTQFDYNMIAIDRDGSSIIDRNGDKTGEKIKFHNAHTLDKKNIENQLE